MAGRGQQGRSGVELNKDGNSNGEETKNVRKEERRTGMEKDKEEERKNEGQERGKKGWRTDVNQKKNKNEVEMLVEGTK